MRRAFRYVRTLFLGISLLLFVATSVLWVRSYRYSEHVTRLGGEYEPGVATLPGYVLVEVWRGDAFGREVPVSGMRYTREPVAQLMMPIEMRVQLFMHPDYLGTSDWRLSDWIVWERRPVRGDLLDVRAVLPFWFLALVTGAWPLTRIARWTLARVRRRRRERAGLCGACGYDLSGVWESERCPECGAAVESD